jgi:hypothetical protein
MATATELEAKKKAVKSADPNWHLFTFDTMQQAVDFTMIQPPAKGRRIWSGVRPYRPCRWVLFLLTGLVVPAKAITPETVLPFHGLPRGS